MGEQNYGGEDDAIMATVEKRISKNGVVSYRAQVRKKGFPKERKTFQTKEAAEAWGRKKDLEIDLFRDSQEVCLATHFDIDDLCFFLENKLHPFTVREDDAGYTIRVEKINKGETPF